MNEQLKEDYVLVFEAPVITPPEFRLYYDESTGKVLFYTCEKPEGKYLVIDRQTFAEGRMDHRIIDGRITTALPSQIVSKLKLTTGEGQKCFKADISLVITDETDVETQTWKYVTYECG